ncbi:hypothetical protein B0T17DRAFT_510161 [Bombardia bombarda]|uniref:Uncharacterized protein n=1 Tax=Bombardia bombarda TaxID=252184 RepID=A0AA39WHN3_9PEZI|nr:hypothetical protein B0T17DRAFT_510161 [Bombardia bombarda]
MTGPADRPPPLSVRKTGSTGLSNCAVSSTISKDNTAGAGAYQAKLLAEFGKRNTKDLTGNKSDDAQPATIEEQNKPIPEIVDQKQHDFPVDDLDSADEDESESENELGVKSSYDYVTQLKIMTLGNKARLEMDRIDQALQESNVADTKRVSSYYESKLASLDAARQKEEQDEINGKKGPGCDRNKAVVRYHEARLELLLAYKRKLGADTANMTAADITPSDDQASQLVALRAILKNNLKDEKKKAEKHCGDCLRDAVVDEITIHRLLTLEKESMIGLLWATTRSNTGIGALVYERTLASALEIVAESELGLFKDAQLRYLKRVRQKLLRYQNRKGV